GGIDQAPGGSQLDDHRVIVGLCRVGKRTPDELVADRVDHVVHVDAQYRSARGERKSEDQYDEETPHSAILLLLDAGLHGVDEQSEFQRFLQRSEDAEVMLPRGTGQNKARAEAGEVGENALD